MSQSDTRAVLSSIPVFARLERSLLEQLAAAAHEQSYAAGDVIIREGDPGVGLFIIRTGRVEALETRDGREDHLAEMGAGDVFGEIAVLEGRPRIATVRALEATLCLVINGPVLRAVLAKAPEQRKEFDALIAERMGIRLPGHE